MVREALHSAQALLAFFALANVDIVVARHVLDAQGSGLYAVGLLVAKIMLYLPQFVVIVMFPSLATATQRRRAVLRGTAAILALGAVCTAGVVLLAGFVADLLDSEKLRAVEGHLWLFAVCSAPCCRSPSSSSTHPRPGGPALDPAGLGRRSPWRWPSVRRRPPRPSCSP